MSLGWRIGRQAWIGRGICCRRGVLLAPTSETTWLVREEWPTADGLRTKELEVKEHSLLTWPEARRAMGYDEGGAR